MKTENYSLVSSSSSSSYICHGVGPPVDPFRSHVSRSLFKGLITWFPLLECQLLQRSTLRNPVCCLPDILSCFSLLLINLTSWWQPWQLDSSMGWT